jgi:hypothetical protein
MGNRRVAGYTVTALLLGGLITAPSAVASSQHQTDSPVVGHLAYIAKDDAVRVAAIGMNGTAESFQTIGPVSPAKTGQKIQVLDLDASGDGAWVAWQELITTGSGTHEKQTTVLVLHSMADGTTLHRATGQTPVGFAGDSLITSNGDHSKVVNVQSTLHFSPVDDTQFPLGTYPGGVVDGPQSNAPAGPKSTWRVRLTTIAGQHTVLHSYVLRPTDYQIPDAAWVSGDGKHLVIERGNHQDFGGLGPSSLADEFSLTGAHHRSQLGNYGTPAAKWRIASVSYAGASDTVWAVWERGTKVGATSVIATFSHGNWQRVMTGGIAVAGNAAGYVVVQKGTYVEFGKDFPEFNVEPSAGAMLVHGSSTLPMNIEGSAFVWVS